MTKLHIAKTITIIKIRNNTFALTERTLPYEESIRKAEWFLDGYVDPDYSEYDMSPVSEMAFNNGIQGMLEIADKLLSEGLDIGSPIIEPDSGLKVTFRMKNESIILIFGGSESFTMHLLTRDLARVNTFKNCDVQTATSEIKKFVS